MGVLGDVIQGIGTGLNFFQQKKQFDYDRSLQQTIFDREDTAVQRRQADLEAAGLSGTLAAGSAATTMSPIRAQVPGAGIGNDIAEAMSLRSSLMRQKADITKTEQDTLRIKAEKDLIDNQNAKIGYELLPMATLLADSAMGRTSVDMSSGEVLSDNSGVPVQKALSYMTLQNLVNDFKTREATKNIAGWNDITAQAGAGTALTAQAAAAHNYGLSSKMGIRTTDNVDAALEAVMRSFGGSGTPYASAGQSIVMKILNALK